MKFDKRLLQRVRIPLGFLFAVIFVVFARPTPMTLLIGGVVAVCGLLIRAWASGHIQKAAVLATGGPYAYTRNPLYLGSLILGIGFTIAAGVWWLAILFVALFLGIYWPVMKVESDDIRRIFGKEYDEYESRVPMLIPRATVWKRTGTKFNYHLYLRYREYRAAIGTLAAVAALAAKMFLIR